MGNSPMDVRRSDDQSGGTIRNFYTHSAWIEGRAVDQLRHVSQWAGVTDIAAFPDLHPGKYGPVGCAVLADRIYPHLIGNDIGCGMSLFRLDLPVRKIKVDKLARRMRALGEPLDTPQQDRLADIDLPPDLFPEALGTIGGGNHFCEVQSITALHNGGDLDTGCAYLMVHSGSRALGNAVFGALPVGSFGGLAGDGITPYVTGHDQAVRWAKLNRQIIAERAAAAMRCDLERVADAPHNLLECTDGGWLHRKGAAVASEMVPVAGSRATPSFLVRAREADGTLGSLAHGAGRRYDRSSMHGRVRGKKSDITAMERTPFGGRVICEDRDLMIEEAPQAYKSSEHVIADLQATGVADPIATLTPLLTFKKTRKEDAR